MKKYWKELDFPIVLNTEFSIYDNSYGVESTRSHEGVTDRKLTWSECLIVALNKIDTEFVIYMQEDYFIDSPVDHRSILSFLTMMEGNKNLKYIGLTNIGNKSPFMKYYDDRLLLVSQNSRYRISTQAAIWRKDTLLSYLVANENGWMFEIFGTRRAKKRHEMFLTCNPKKFNDINKPIINYIHTGIIKGKWHNEIPKVFASNNIEIEFDNRGFYVEKPFLLRKLETFFKLVKNPYVFYKGMRGL
jgi:hypothetical protein